MKRLFCLLVIVLMLLCGCASVDEDKIYDEGYEDGYDDGYRDGAASVTDAEEPAAEAPAAEEPAAEAPVVSDGEPAYEMTYQHATVYTNSIGTVWVQVIAEYVNTGDTALYLNGGAYDLENADGTLFATESYVSVYPEVIEPGEKAYLYDETILESAPAGELTVLPRIDAEAAAVPCTRFPVTEGTLLEAEFYGLSYRGRVENTSAVAQDSVTVACILFDANGLPIGLMSTYLAEELLPAAKIGFECMAMGLPESVTADAVASTVVYAYPHQYQW